MKGQSRRKRLNSKHRQQILTSSRKCWWILGTFKDKGVPEWVRGLGGHTLWGTGRFFLAPSKPEDKRSVSEYRQTVSQLHCEIDVLWSAAYGENGLENQEPSCQGLLTSTLDCFFKELLSIPDCSAHPSHTIFQSAHLITNHVGNGA